MSPMAWRVSASSTTTQPQVCWLEPLGAWKASRRHASTVDRSTGRSKSSLFRTVRVVVRSSSGLRSSRSTGWSPSWCIKLIESRLCRWTERATSDRLVRWRRAITMGSTRGPRLRRTRRSGLFALVGVVLSLGVLLVFVFPALLTGSAPIAVALVGTSVIAFGVLYLAHGINERTTVALLGTLASLALTAVLAVTFAGAARLSGLASEDSTTLLTFAPELDYRGLLLAAVIIGTLGVLDDVTVTQVSAVWELHRANPGQGRRQLYGSAIRIGRDHIASTVNTLILAYAAAALPLMLLFTQSGLALGDVLTTETIAVEVVQTLVGSIGLVASVPLTTTLAS